MGEHTRDQGDLLYRSWICCKHDYMTATVVLIETDHNVQGGATGAVLASQIEDVNVTVVDINKDRIDAWNSNTLPISAFPNFTSFA